MRNAFADEILRLADLDSRIVVLSGDIGNRLFDKFKSRYPSRFYNCGVAEANMISMAAGMANCGLRPVCYTIAPFVTTRCLEQIKLDVCYHHMPVIIVGTGAGLSYASLGATHHSFEDIAIMRVLPGMNVLAPGDSNELRSCLGAAVTSASPSYIRIGKKGEPLVYSEVPDFQIGRWHELHAGNDVALLAAGNMLPVAVEVADQLHLAGTSAAVVSAASIKPLDTAYLAKASTRFDVVATVEEHSLIGGLGSAVADWLILNKPEARPRLLRFAIPDEFAHQAGEQEYARKLFGLDATSIAAAVLSAVTENSHAYRR
jgi:transketolase